MNFTVANLRNKKVVLTTKQDIVSLNEEKLNVTELAYAKCSLKKEHFNLILKLETPWNKKSVLFLDSKSWVKESKNDNDDEDAIERIQEPIMKFISLITGSVLVQEMTEKASFQGRMEGTFDMARVYVTNTAIISPDVKKYIPTGNIDYVFFERMSSYQKNFDLTFVEGSKCYRVDAINRKEFYRTILKNIVQEYGFKYFEGGPDPLPWGQLIKTKEREKKSWQEMIESYLQVEEEGDEEDCSDWEDESEEEDDDDDDDEFDDCVDEEEEEEEDGEFESESEDEFERDDTGYLVTSDNEEDDSDYDEPPPKKAKVE